MFDALIDEASVSQGAERLRMVEKLASTPNDTLNAITSGYHKKSRWRPMMEVLQAIGYPNNASAIPWLVEHLDKNSPAWDETLAVLRGISPDAIAPYLVSDLWPSDSRRGEWGYNVESICEAVVALGRDYAIPCGPTVAYILSLHVNPAVVDPAYLLDTLQTVGESGVVYALPALLGFAESTSIAEQRERALQLVTTLERGQAGAYAVVIRRVIHDMTNLRDVDGS